MTHWNSSLHPISDIRDWSKAKRLEIRPDFQRGEVWSNPARIMLMDTILRGIPMPKIFLARTIHGEETYRKVIDGQQRIASILAFLRNDFSLKAPYSGDEEGKTFSQLDEETQSRFLSYSIDFNEAINPTDEEIREVYSRVNKYTVALNKQELRRADFPGDFLELSEQLAGDSYFDLIRIFTPGNRRRCTDVEYISELLAAMLDGPQDKKSTLDSFYINYAKWDDEKQEEMTIRFSNVLKELRLLFNSSLDISKSRFRKKADFYTIFLVVNDFVAQAKSLKGRNLEPLQKDLKILQEHISPESKIKVCSEYAIKCVSQANSASSRRWRHQFLQSILAGTYVGEKPEPDAARLFYRMREQLDLGDPLGVCPDSVFNCGVCDKKISENFNKCVLAWRKTDTSMQISNAEWLHHSCIKDQSQWRVVERPKK